MQVRNSLVNEIHCVNIENFDKWINKLRSGSIGVQDGNTSLMLFSDAEGNLRYLTAADIDSNISIVDIHILDWYSLYKQFNITGYKTFIFNPRDLIHKKIRDLMMKIIIIPEPPAKEVVSIFDKANSFIEDLI